MTPAQTKRPIFIDLGFSQRNKHGEYICGDAFKFRKSPDGDRITAVLSDGLGSGVKANILSSMTAVMALEFASQEDFDVLHAAETMMSALPICNVRKISYATFTILNATLSGEVRLVEMGNPRFLYFHCGIFYQQPYEELRSEKWHDRTMNVSRFEANVGDRIVFFSDGVSQAGLGTKQFPLGWNEEHCKDYLSLLLDSNPGMSSQELCESVIQEALSKEKNRTHHDDITCAALNFRPTRRILLFTGPPYDGKRDRECALYLDTFHGDKVVCGGTSADIVSRELGRSIRTDLTHFDPDLPPISSIDGVDLVTEGVFTLTRTASLLENFAGAFPDNAAGKLTRFLLQNDEVEFLVGTRVNEAHQDPNLPQELDIRRNIVARIAKVLKENFYKKVTIKYV